jgi:drug/metabolite transporter (DMT)-like permease
VFLGEWLRPLGIAGLVAGLIGVTLIMGARITGGIDPFGLMLCCIGVIALTIATLSVRGATSGGNFLMIVGLQMLVGCVALALATLLFETPRLNPSWPLLAAFTYTTLVPGLAATFVWFWLVNRIGATRAATFHFLNPFLGVAIAAVLLREPLGGRDLLGVAIIAAGILAVQLSRQARR